MIFMGRFRRNLVLKVGNKGRFWTDKRASLARRATGACQ